MSPSQADESEVKAYSAIIDLAHVFELDQQDVDFFKDQVKTYADHAKQDAGKSWGQVREEHPDWLPAMTISDTKETGSPEPGDPGYLEPVKEASEIDFSRWAGEGSQTLAQDMKKTAAAQTQAWRQAQEKRRAQYWQAMEDWAGHACNEMKSGKNDDDEAYMNTHSIVFEDAELSPLLKADHHKLTGCQKKFIKLVLKAPAPIDADWLGKKLRYHIGGGALGAIARGIEDGTVGLVKGLAFPFVAVGKALVSGSGSDHEGRNDSRDRQTHELHEGPAMHQLRGISSSGIGFD
jgi:hypothetical protein